MIREHEGTSLRSFHGPGSRVKRSFQSDGEARAVLRQVLAAAGLSGMEDRILLRASAEIDAAEAGIEKDKDGNDERLIFYNAEFMQRLRQQTREYWSMVAVLAHEVGHHVRLHTVIVGRDHEFELEADYQAGFILRRMGASLEQAQAAFRAIAPEKATETHPGRAQRVQAVTLGWTDGGAIREAKAQTAVTPLAEPTREQIARDLQAALKRVGCYGGDIDGKWGRKSAEALQEFGRRSGIALPSEPSMAIVDTVARATGIVCAVKDRGTAMAPVSASRPVVPATGGQSQPVVAPVVSTPRPDDSACSKWRQCASSQSDSSRPADSDMRVFSACGAKPQGC